MLSKDFAVRENNEIRQWLVGNVGSRWMFCLKMKDSPSYSDLFFKDFLFYYRERVRAGEGQREKKGSLFSGART